MSDLDLNQLVVTDEHRGGGVRPMTLLIVAAALAVLAWFGYEAWEAWKPRRWVTTAQPVLRQDSKALRTAGFEAAGWVEPDPFPDVVPSLIPGWVTEVHAVEGETVQAGDLLVELYDEDYKLEIRRIEARGNTLRAELAYWETQIDIDGKLVAAQALDELSLKRSRTEADKLRAELQELDVQLELAKRNLERCKIHAPVDGVVLRRHVSHGTHITPDGHIFAVLTLYHPESLQARIDVNLADVEKMYLGQACEVRVESLPGEIFTGSVVRIVHEADNQKNTIQAKVHIDDPDGKFKPEMLVRAKFLAREQPAGAAVETVQVIYAPEAALLADGDAYFVFVVEGFGRKAVARRVPVKKGTRKLEDLIEIESGLNPTSQLIVSSPSTLRDGDAIRTE